MARNGVITLSRQDARRVAIRAQLLTRDRPTDLIDTIRHLTMVQLEPTAYVAPSADVVLWSRLGSSYRPQDLRDALDEQRLVELRERVRPPEDIALFRAEMAAWPGTGGRTDWREQRREWLADNNECRLDILERLRSDGPLPADELPDTCVRPWESTGWNAGRNVRMMLDLLVQRGEVASAGGIGKERLWDLAERVYPDDPVVPAEEAARIRDERRLRSLGIARSRGTAAPVESEYVGLAGREAEVEGVRGRWRVDPELLDLSFRGRAALLSPLDRLVFDRGRALDLFEFDYQLEMYKPVAKRRWGYWAMPVLYGDRLVGKLDTRADRDEGVLRVHALHWDVPPSRAMESGVLREIRDLARWLRLGLVLTDAGPAG